VRPGERRVGPAPAAAATGLPIGRTAGRQRKRAAVLAAQAIRTARPHGQGRDQVRPASPILAASETGTSSTAHSTVLHSRPRRPGWLAMIVHGRHGGLTHGGRQYEEGVQSDARPRQRACAPVRIARTSWVRVAAMYGCCRFLRDGHDIYARCILQAASRSPRSLAPRVTRGNLPDRAPAGPPPHPQGSQEKARRGAQ
jgi:hypothetical protein